MKTITTVEELGALPEGAVIAFEDIGTPNAAVLASTEDGPRWWTTVDAPSANGDGYPHESIWSFYGESGEPGITLIHPLVFTAEDELTAVLPIIEKQVRAAWAEEIRAIEIPEHNLHDQMPSDHWYAGQKIMRDEIAALLEGGAE